MFNFTSICCLALADPLNILVDQSSGLSKNDSQKQMYTSVFREVHNVLLSPKCIRIMIILLKI